MAIRRIVANLPTPDPVRAREFYGRLLGLDVVMDHGWLMTFASGGTQTPQVSVASQGGSDTPVPALSIEVDDVDATLARARAHGVEIVYGPCDEPWGVRRFYVRDPFGNLINILMHRQ